jgi:hypothetical protein
LRCPDWLAALAFLPTSRAKIWICALAPEVSMISAIS